jgi:hypothetical protein
MQYPDGLKNLGECLCKPFKTKLMKIKVRKCDCTKIGYSSKDCYTWLTDRFENIK